MEWKWNLKSEENADTVNKLSKALNVNRNISRLLVRRGVKSFKNAHKFFRPSLQHLHDPFLMKDMDKAVARLSKAIDKNEKILIYGDYDVDGTTSVSLCYNFISEILSDKINGKQPGYYVPDRYDEGYGISEKGLIKAGENSYDLIIALDCGIKANDKAKLAKELGIDLIICDHHTPGDKIPEAAAVLDPKRHDCNYPYKHLSGCGVGFKLLEAYSEKNNIPKEKLYNYLDLVVVSIGSDIVPITGENRILAHYGLKKLNHSPQTGLQTIIDLGGLTNKNIVISDIVFKIGPRINAAGRMESGKKAVELLVTKDKDKDKANKISLEINEINNTRKDLDHDITDQALEQIKNTDGAFDAKTTIVHSDKWHKGVIGIVASRLIEHHYRPTVVLTESNGSLSGSARSVPGFNLYEAIEYCSPYLQDFGGHMYAAGMTLKPEMLESFKENFEKYVSENIKPEQLQPTINADLELEIKDINEEFYKILKQFAPFGPDNMKPVFISRNVYDNGNGKTVGKNHDHLKLSIIQHLGDNRAIDAIGFGFGDKYDIVKDYKAFDICYTIEENEFMGHKNIQMLIKDIKPAKLN